ncbi:MAG: hypothetical protein BJ554DRAFT_1960, partial [Olpidium bornovanus]
HARAAGTPPGRAAAAAATPGRSAAATPGRAAVPAHARAAAATPAGPTISDQDSVDYEEVPMDLTPPVGGILAISSGPWTPAPTASPTMRFLARGNPGAIAGSAGAGVRPRGSLGGATARTGGDYEQGPASADILPRWSLVGFSASASVLEFGGGRVRAVVNLDNWTLVVLRSNDDDGVAAVSDRIFVSACKDPGVAACSLFDYFNLQWAIGSDAATSLGSDPNAVSHTVLTRVGARLMVAEDAGRT